MPKSIDSLSAEIMKQYASRKKPGRLSLVIDVSTGKSYPIPKDVEHVDFVKHLGTNPSCLIPVHIDFNANKIIDVLTGESGLELKLNIKHSYIDLCIANDVAYCLIHKSGIELHPNHINKIHFEYAR